MLSYSKVNKYLKVLFFILILLSLFFAFWYVVNGDLTFSSDIARDFLLFGEIKVPFDKGVDPGLGFR